MSKTRPRPGAAKSKTNAVKPYRVDDKTTFPDMMRRITQTAWDWVKKEPHSEKLKPYLFDLDISYPEIDDLYPIPLDIEFPGTSGESWTDIGGLGVETWRFQCILHCRHKAAASATSCTYPVKCWFGAWTPVTNPCGRFEWVAVDDANNVIPLNCVWWEDKGINGEVWFTPKSGSWTDYVLDNDYVKVKFMYHDKGQAEGQYYHPKLKQWIVIEEGQSICDDIVKVFCQPCPVDPVMTFDDASTPDTIDPNDSITVVVAGGLPPYSWSIAYGTGYSLASPTTSGLSNTLTCIDGSCGDFTAIVGIDVTDACDDTVSFQVRNTDGTSWDTIGSCQSPPGCTPWDDLGKSYVLGGCRWERYDDVLGNGDLTTCTEGPSVSGACPEDTDSPPSGTCIDYYTEWSC